MTANTNSTIKPIAVAATAALVLSGVIYEQTNILPVSEYQIPEIETQSFTNYMNFENINKLELTIFDKIDVMNEFLKKLTETKDLDSRIVHAINDNFWDLI